MEKMSCLGVIILKGSLWLIILLLLLCPYQAEASFENHWIPIRILGLGDSTSSLLLTPKVGQSLIVTERMSIQSANLERIVIAGEKINDDFRIGFYWTRFGDSEIAPNLSYVEDIKAIRGTFSVSNKLIAGVQIKKYLLQSIENGSGFGLDLGIQASVTPKLKIGLECREIINQMTYTTGSVERAPIAIKMMAEANFRNNTQYYISLNDQHEINFGFEFAVVPELDLRAGIANGQLAGGVSLYQNNWHIEYGLFGTELGKQQVLSLGRFF